MVPIKVNGPTATGGNLWSSFNCVTENHIPIPITTKGPVQNPSALRRMRSDTTGGMVSMLFARGVCLALLFVSSCGPGGVGGVLSTFRFFGPNPFPLVWARARTSFLLLPWLSLGRGHAIERAIAVSRRQAHQCHLRHVQSNTLHPSPSSLSQSLTLNPSLKSPLTQCLSPSIPSHTILSHSMPLTLNPHPISLLDRSPAPPLAVGFSANVCSLRRFHRDLLRRYRWRVFLGTMVRTMRHPPHHHEDESDEDTRARIQQTLQLLHLREKRERDRWKGSTCTWHAATCTDSRWTTT